MLYDAGIPSQNIRPKTISNEKRLPSIVRNILNQINNKMGNDTFQVTYSPKVSSETMLIGIDVCHGGKKSIVGFASSYNKEMTKYLSQAFE
jgi:argonaute-like protein implicated in RNA metabolism and viral defense